MFIKIINLLYFYIFVKFLEKQCKYMAFFNLLLKVFFIKMIEKVYN